MTCESIKILSDNQFKSATVTTPDTTLTNYPITNIKHSSRQHTTRWATSSTIEIKFVLESRNFADFFVLFGNQSSSATTTIKLYDSDDWTGTAVYESGNLQQSGYVPLGVFTLGIHSWGEKDEIYNTFTSKVSFDKVAFESGIITITDTTNPDGYIEARMAMIGILNIFENPADPGDTIKHRGDSPHKITKSGYAVSTGTKGRGRVCNYSFTYSPDNDRTKIARIEQLNGDDVIYIMGKPWLNGALGEDYEMACLITSPIIKTHTGYNAHSYSFEATEV